MDVPHLPSRISHVFVACLRFLVSKGAAKWGPIFKTEKILIKSIS
jgi:hypothetical protein